MLQTSDDANKQQGSRFYDHITNSPVAVFTNAAANEVWFCDFDSDVYETYGNYSDSGTLGNVTDRNGKNAKTLTSGKFINYTLTKNALAANYIFSAWLNATTAGTLTIKLTPTTGSVVTSTISFPVTSGWQYFEKLIPVTGMTSSFAIRLTIATPVNIDDILFYPENAEAASYAYDAVQFFKICETNTNGVSAYYKYDNWGRLIYAYDQDHNIVRKNTYVTPADVRLFGPGTFAQSHQSANTSTAVNLRTKGSSIYCGANNTTFTWDFGDGSSPVLTYSPSAPSHIYTHTGTYIANLTTNSPVFGLIKSKDTITVTSGPATNITYYNNTTANGHVSTAAFYNGATLIASFTEAQLLAGTAQVTKGTYTMKVTMASGSQQYPYPSGGSGGYGGLTETGDGGVNLCQIYSSTNFYSFTINLGACDNLTFSVLQTVPCGP